MRILLAAALLVAGATLSACGGGSPPTAVDPAGAAGGPPMPTSIPAADGPVRTRDLVTVMDTGRPELCLGPVAESYPPQCSGLPIRGWDWGDHHRVFDRVGEVRWGMFAVSGTFDGTTLTLTDATPAALYDPARPEEPTRTAPAVQHTDAELADIAAEVRDLPGELGTSVVGGAVRVEVVYDDGSLQEWADRTYGAGVVVLGAALVDQQ